MLVVAAGLSAGAKIAIALPLLALAVGMAVFVAHDMISYLLPADDHDS